MSTPNRQDGIDEETVVRLLIGAGVLALITLMLVEWPLLIASTLHGQPTLMPPVQAVSGGIHWLVASGHGDPRAVAWWHAYRHVLPSPAAWIALDAVLVLAIAAAASVTWANVDRWRGRRDVASSDWHPRSRVTPRAWARPRDLLHLQPADERTSIPRRAVARATRLARGERRPGPRPDSWSLGRLNGAELRSLPESHLLAVAPTRAGKTTRVLIPALLENDGPAIVLSNKTDVLRATLRYRSSVGPVWVYAPTIPPQNLDRHRCTWTPLQGCEDWDFALRMGRWLLDADGSSSAGDESSGARFYNREAYAVALRRARHGRFTTRRADGREPSRSAVSPMPASGRCAPAAAGAAGAADPRRRGGAPGAAGQAARGRPAPDGSPPPASSRARTQCATVL